MKNKYTLISFLALLISFSGCVGYDLSWKPIEGAGPYLSEGVFAKAFQKCEQRLMDGAPQCRIAFEDEFGNKQEVFHDLVSELDRLVLKIPESNTWGRTRSVPVEVKVPYKLFLVTISPIIIIAVPAPQLKTEACWSDAPRGQCLRSYTAYNNGYSLSNSIPIVDGSVWLSPATTKSVHPIPSGVDEYAFPLDGIDAKLIQEDGIWKFFRKRHERH
ncbi:hypothetical protein GJ699_18805 [Duganella sp. FT80W]|uniref:Lipoprotein n=1 Tax=Duganella guangzhouensis TaxID=2666084 RepID=A0A6I2L1K8_9BURK|nr:hypothetical protein [Duganella guangzhouensis]MRW92048.1 hypothetical protein [Duganella guangzhouensis]